MGVVPSGDGSIMSCKKCSQQLCAITFNKATSLNEIFCFIFSLEIVEYNFCGLRCEISSHLALWGVRSSAQGVQSRWYSFNFEKMYSYCSFLMYSYSAAQK